MAVLRPARLAWSSPLRSSECIGNRSDSAINSNLQIIVENDRDFPRVDFHHETDKLSVNCNILPSAAFLQEANSVWHGKPLSSRAIGFPRARLRHHLDETPEKIMAVLRAGRGFRMVLHRKGRPIGQRQPAIRAVEQRDMGFPGIVRQRVASTAKPWFIETISTLSVVKSLTG